MHCSCIFDILLLFLDMSIRCKFVLLNCQFESFFWLDIEIWKLFKKDFDPLNYGKNKNDIRYTLFFPHFCAPFMLFILFILLTHRLAFRARLHFCGRVFLHSASSHSFGSFRNRMSLSSL